MTPPRGAHERQPSPQRVTAAHARTGRRARRRLALRGGRGGGGPQLLASKMKEAFSPASFGTLSTSRIKLMVDVKDSPKNSSSMKNGSIPARGRRGGFLPSDKGFAGVHATTCILPVCPFKPMDLPAQRTQGGVRRHARRSRLRSPCSPRILASRAHPEPASSSTSPMPGSLAATGSSWPRRLPHGSLGPPLSKERGGEDWSFRECTHCSCRTLHSRGASCCNVSGFAPSGVISIYIS